MFSDAIWRLWLTNRLKRRKIFNYSSLRRSSGVSLATFRSKNGVSREIYHMWRNSYNGGWDFSAPWWLSANITIQICFGCHTMISYGIHKTWNRAWVIWTTLIMRLGCFRASQMWSLWMLLDRKETWKDSPKHEFAGLGIALWAYNVRHVITFWVNGSLKYELILRLLFFSLNVLYYVR